MPRWSLCCQSRSAESCSMASLRNQSSRTIRCLRWSSMIRWMKSASCVLIFSPLYEHVEGGFCYTQPLILILWQRSGTSPTTATGAPCALQCEHKENQGPQHFQPDSWTSQKILVPINKWLEVNAPWNVSTKALMTNFSTLAQQRELSKGRMITPY